MRQFSVDLDRLHDDGYMEVITTTAGWSRLEQFFRASLIVEFLDQLRRSGASDSVRDQVIKTFLRNLSSEKIEELRQAIMASDFLDTLILSLNDRPS